MQRFAFKIRGMDCAEEVALLKREVGPLVGGEENLAFDLVNGKMIVTSAVDKAIADKVCVAVAKTGMEAIPWEQFWTSDGRPPEATFWQRRRRTLLCLVSGMFLVAGFVVHVMAHGSFVAALMHAAGTDKQLFPVTSILLYLGAVISGAWFIAPKALLAARRLRPDMNLLMTVAVAGAMGIGGWFEAATVTFLFALALLLESWSITRARRAIGTLMALSPGKARCVNPEDGHIEEKPVAEIPLGSTVVVRPGEKIPLDGSVTKGYTAVNQAPITGESVPVTKQEGDEVFAGTINGDGAFEFRVTRPSYDTTLSRIIRMVEEAHSRRSPSEQWVERFARYYTPVMMAVAFFLGIVPPLLFGGEWSRWFYDALVILVIACPCALVISTPVSIVAGLTAASRAGVLIKGGVYLETPARLKAVALDKTGTLTHGHPEVQEVVPVNHHTAQELLARAAALEFSSEHPLARAILRKATATGVSFTPAEDFNALKGRGGQARIDGRDFWIGNHRLMHEKGVETHALHEKAQALEAAGYSVVALGNNRHVCGLISIADDIRDQAAMAVAALKVLGIQRVVMLTGDNHGTAGRVAEVIGVDEFKAELLPQDKVETVTALVQEFNQVAMVGDGVNDAPALAAATVGIAMGAIGTDAAIETADIALMSDDLSKLPWLVRHSRRTLRIIKQNIWFALALKMVFMGLALAGLATLWMAIAADMGASLLVIFNSLRLVDGQEPSLASQGHG